LYELQANSTHEDSNTEIDIAKIGADLSSIETKAVLPSDALSNKRRSNDFYVDNLSLFLPKRSKHAVVKKI
jgi:hypothetical protein